MRWDNLVKLGSELNVQTIKTGGILRSLSGFVMCSQQWQIQLFWDGRHWTVKNANWILLKLLHIADELLFPNEQDLPICSSLQERGKGCVVVDFQVPA